MSEQKTSGAAATAGSRDFAAGAWTAARTWLPGIAAALLGAAIVAGVGFAPGALHDAAHDVRHTMMFPCH
jgi:cobalt transporter subunit CbtB